ncbi:uncharacterized protein C8orf76 homolog isoform X2 [Ambystoma mexicanum]|uniref:uncharacterized protein C8orf76 homolog isoform X2 n=1 Tax=Ambystoma mexicanum TaxID=8296 RepID=UPI0037E7AB8F
MKWFCGEISTEDSTEVVTAKKFCGDLAYRQHDFQKALLEYGNCFSLLSSTNIAMRRDVQESQARCLSHLGRHSEALDLAQKLRAGSTNTDHLTTVLNLQVAIYQEAGNVLQVIACLQQLISLHPFNPWHWKTLAEAYLDILPGERPSSATKINHQGQIAQTLSGQGLDNKLFGSCRDQRIDCHYDQIRMEPCGPSAPSQDSKTCPSKDQLTEPLFSAACENEQLPMLLEACTLEDFEELWMKSCASLIRTRLLLQLVQPQQSSFILEKNLRAQSTIEEKLKAFGMNEERWTLIAEIMGEDLAQERLKEEMQAEGKVGVTAALASFVIPSEADFECRWFLKVKDGLKTMAPCFRGCLASQGATTLETQ